MCVWLRWCVVFEVCVGSVCVELCMCGVSGVCACVCVIEVVCAVFERCVCVWLRCVVFKVCVFEVYVVFEGYVCACG